MAPEDTSLSGSRTVIFAVTHSAAGGAQEIWVNLAEGFVARGYRVVLMALYPSTESVRETHPGLSWTYVATKRPAGLLGKLNLLGSLYRTLAEIKPDMIYSALPGANIMIAITARLLGLKDRVIISHHSPANTYGWVAQHLDYFTGGLNSVSAIVSVSNTVMSSQDNRPASYRRKRTTIHNALPPRIEALLDEITMARKSRSRNRLVIATGRLAKQKNYDVLLRAARHMPDVTVHIIGTGPVQAELVALSKTLGVDGRVQFLGFSPRMEALNSLGTAAVFAQPSLFEGHSLGLIEAAKIGLPLVVSDVPVQIEAITDPSGELCGVAVDPQDDAGLARAILDLLDDDSRYDDYAQRALRLAAGATFETMVGEYERLMATGATQ